jgi:hypothetical protein
VRDEEIRVASDRSLGSVDGSSDGNCAREDNDSGRGQLELLQTGNPEWNHLDVEPGTKSVFVTGSDEVSYKFLVTNKTKIEIGGTTSSIEDLAGQTQKQVTITFVARRNGNFAQSISVSG